VFAHQEPWKDLLPWLKCKRATRKELGGRRDGSPRTKARNSARADEAAGRLVGSPPCRVVPLSAMSDRPAFRFIRHASRSPSPSHAASTHHVLLLPIFGWMHYLDSRWNLWGLDTGITYQCLEPMSSHPIITGPMANISWKVIHVNTRMILGELYVQSYWPLPSQGHLLEPAFCRSYRVSIVFDSTIVIVFLLAPGYESTKVLLRCDSARPASTSSPWIQQTNTFGPYTERIVAIVMLHQILCRANKVIVSWRTLGPQTTSNQAQHTSSNVLVPRYRDLSIATTFSRITGFGSGRLQRKGLSQHCCPCRVSEQVRRQQQH